MRPCHRCGGTDRNKNGNCRACQNGHARAFHHGATLEQLITVWHAQAGFCALTGQKLESLRKAEVDHFIPRSRGGTDDLFNLRLVCRQANRAKGNMLDEEFFTLCERVIQHAKTQGR